MENSRSTSTRNLVRPQSNLVPETESLDHPGRNYESRAPAVATLAIGDRNWDHGRLAELY